MLLSIVLGVMLVLLEATMEPRGRKNCPPPRRKNLIPLQVRRRKAKKAVLVCFKRPKIWVFWREIAERREGGVVKRREGGAAWIARTQIVFRESRGAGIARGRILLLNLN
jgi:hypothetical protein